MQDNRSCQTLVWPLCGQRSSEALIQYDESEPPCSFLVIGPGGSITLVMVTFKKINKAGIKLWNRDVLERVELVHLLCILLYNKDF